VAFAHRQDDAPFLLVDGLSRPLDRVEPDHSPRVLHAHLGVFFAKFARGGNSSHKRSHDGLNRLAMQRKTPFHCLTERALVGPSEVVKARLLVGFHTFVPHAGRFHLRLLETAEMSGR